MSTWYITPTSKDVIHGNHKYIDKIWKNGKWRYIYEDVKHKTKHKINNTIGIGKKNRFERAEKHYKDERNKARLLQKEINKLADQSLSNNQELESKRQEHLKQTERVKRARMTAANANYIYSKTLMSTIDQIKESGLKSWTKFTNFIFNHKKSPKTTITNRSAYGYTPEKQYTPSYKRRK